MLSVIVYGRNDNFGYNYHKRVSLSLNAFALHLDGEGDEIIFVDYNTADECPTLPEAIADTLTPATKSKLRVLRVRPKIHRRYAAGSHLGVIEPVARNVGLRQSNPRNRWILSTNADNVLVSRGGQTLSAICGSLQAGHYGLPRFEVPEALWELADRSDPKATQAKFETWAAAACLEEVVHGIGEVAFDNPGDFQLALRTDLFDIDAFDEQMLLGWHVDHNLAKRLGFRYGAPRSLATRLKLYHCAHTRQHTATHQGNRTQNDPVRFVHALTQPELPRQRDAWGCPSDEIEEVRLTNARNFDSMVTGLFDAPEPPRPAVFDSASFGNLYYGAEHVVPFVLSVLSTYAPTTVIGYAGARRDTFEHLCKGLAALGFVHRILVPEELDERLNLSDNPNVQLVGRDVFYRRPDVLLFEFGAIRDESGAPRDAHGTLTLTEAEERTLEDIYRLFAAAAEFERDRVGGRGAAPRRFIAINSIHNRYQTLVERALSTSAAPFTTRLRHGYVSSKQTASQQADTIFSVLGTAQNRVYPVSVQEFSNAYGMISSVIQGGQVSERERPSFVAAAPLVLAYLEQPSASAVFPESEIRSARDYFSKLLVSSVPVGTAATIVETRASPGERAPSGLACAADWDDDAWLQCARDIVDHNDPAAATSRNGWVWERTQLLYALERAKLVGSDVRALVVCKLPEPVIGHLSFRVGTLDIVDADTLFESGFVPERGVDHWAAGARYNFGHVRVTSLADSVAPDRKYDLVIAPHAAAFGKRVPGLVSLLRGIDSFLADNATIILAGDVALSGRLAELRPTPAMAGKDGLGRVLKQHTGLRLADDDFDASLARLDLRLVGDLDQVGAGAPCLGFRQSGDVLWPSIWVIERAGPTRDWDAASNAVKKLYLGEQLPMLRLGPTGEAVDGKIAGGEGNEGTVFFGPYLVLPSGNYRVTLSARVAPDSGSSRDALIRIEIALGAEILATSEARIGRRPKQVELGFYAEPRSSEELFEIRCWSDGSARVLFEKVELIERN